MTEIFNSQRKTRSRSAFSFMEVLSAITILAVMLALLMPAVKTITRRAEAIRCAANLRQLHTATMLFFADNKFFPIGYSDDYIPGYGAQPPPGAKWSHVRRPNGNTGIYTHWQIEIAPYLDGYVQEANWVLYPDAAMMPAATAWDPQGDDPSAWRLPMQFRCPGYNRYCSDPANNWHHPTGDVAKDHYGYCYNQYVLVGNGKKEAAYTTGTEQHKGRDPRLIVTGYAPGNSAAHTLMMFCSRWPVWQSKVGTFASDLSGLPNFGASPGDPEFRGYPFTSPYGAAGIYCGVAAGIHNGNDNFLFLDGHVEVLNRLNPEHRRRMNKTWWRPLPIDASFGHYSWNSANDFQVAYIYDNLGRPVGHLSSNGATAHPWPVNILPANYNWDY